MKAQPWMHLAWAAPALVVPLVVPTTTAVAAEPLSAMPMGHATVRWQLCRQGAEGTPRRCTGTWPLCGVSCAGACAFPVSPFRLLACAPADTRTTPCVSLHLVTPLAQPGRLMVSPQRSTHLQVSAQGLLATPKLPALAPLQARPRMSGRWYWVLPVASDDTCRSLCHTQQRDMVPRHSRHVDADTSPVAVPAAKPTHSSSVMVMAVVMQHCTMVTKTPQGVICRHSAETSCSKTLISHKHRCCHTKLQQEVLFAKPHRPAELDSRSTHCSTTPIPAFAGAVYVWVTC
jgi:hypothetical protein